MFFSKENYRSRSLRLERKGFTDLKFNRMILYFRFEDKPTLAISKQSSPIPSDIEK